MKVIMYTMSTCPWCRKTKKFFTDNKIPFEYTDYDLATDEEQKKIMDTMLKKGADGIFPFVIIGKDVVIGYHPEKYSELLRLKK